MVVAISTSKTLSAALATVLCLQATSAMAVVVSDRTRDHVVRPGRPSFGFNLDGVGLVGIDSPNSTTIEDILVTTCNAALISDRHLLSAAHCYDDDGNGVVDAQLGEFGFPVVAGFELEHGDVLIRVDIDNVHFPASWTENETDIAVVELLEPAPAEIPRYRLYGKQDDLGQKIVVTGYGATGFGDTGVNPDTFDSFTKRAGFNRIETFFDGRELELGYDFDSGLEANNALTLVGSTSDLGFGIEEVMAAEQDSGAPIFVGDVIVGVQAFNAWLRAADFNDEFDSSWGEVAFATRVSSFQDFILEATNGEAVFVPEPIASLPLALMGFLAFSLHRPRRVQMRGWG